MPSNIGKARSYPLRLPLTMRRELTALAKSEGISLNQLISLAVAEKDHTVSAANCSRSCR